MKKAATILSWIGGVLTIILEFYYLSFGTYASETKLECGYYYSYSCQIKEIRYHVNYPFIVWFVVGLIALVQIAILIWRQNSVESGEGIAASIFTIIFCGVIGGIFSLIVATSNRKYRVPAVKERNNYKFIKIDNEIQTLNEEEYKEAIAKQKEYLEKGFISKDRYDVAIDEIRHRTDSTVLEKIDKESVDISEKK